MIQRPLIDPLSDWAPTAVRDLPRWPERGRVAIDVETKEAEDFKKNGTGLRRDPTSRVVGISFAIEDGPAHYLPIGHEAGGNLDPDHVWRYLDDQAAGFLGTVVGANLPYDLDWLDANGVRFTAAEWFKDVQIADPIIYEMHERYTLDAILKRHGLPGKTEDGLDAAAAAWGFTNIKGGAKGNLWRLPAKHVGPYAIDDAVLPLVALRRQERVIEEAGTWGVWEMECKVLPILLKMKQRGVRIDQDHLAQVEHRARRNAERYLKFVKQQTGVEIAVDNLNQKGGLIDALKRAGVETFPLTDGGKKREESGEPLRAVDLQINAEFLKHSGRVGAAILGAKKVDKLRRTFCESVRRYMVDGRVHTTFNQLKRQEDGSSDLDGTITGRLSSKHPNLQQQPGRGAIGKWWRRIYLPDEGKLWAKLDYSAQEPRIMVHAAVASGLPMGAEFADKYATDPKTDFHQMVTNFAIAAGADVDRSQCKIAGLATAYGAGKGKTAMQLGFPYHEEEKWGRTILIPDGPETEQVLDAINRAVPFIAQLQRMARDAAGRNGYIRTAGGRLLHFPKKKDGNGYDWLHKAFNKFVQGTAADQTKLALIAADEAGFPIQLQVHDELDGSFESREEAETCAALMETCLELQCVSRVDPEVGPNWGDLS